MSGQKDEEIKAFESEADEILHSIVIEQAFLKNRKRITSFIEQNSFICCELINNQQSKTCLFMLTKLYNVCIEVLRSFPAELDPKGEVRQFFTHLRLREKTNLSYSKGKAIDIPAFIFLVQSFGKLPDITEIKNNDHFHYLLVIEFFLLTVNNLSYINLKRNKHEVTIDYLLRALECFNLLQFSSYYIKYNLSTIIINLIYLTEDNYREEASQLLCNLALYMEKLEKEIDSHPQSKNVYEHLNIRAFNFTLFLEIGNQVFAQKTFNNKKSFFIARMCVTLAYYGDLLDELGRKQDSVIAREHTKALEQQLLKLEQRGDSEENKLTQENINKRFNDRRSNSRRESASQDDNKSSTSFKTSHTGFTGTIPSDNQAKISKEDIIFQKYVEVNGVKFKIIMIHLKELQALQIMLYSKPRNILKKAFVHFQEILDHAKKNNISLGEDGDPSKLLTKIAKLLYFKDNELLMREIQYFKSIEELKVFKMKSQL